MELKNRTELVVKKDDKECRLVCDCDASLGFIFDALMEMRQFVVGKIQETSNLDKKNEEQPIVVE